ncbi:MAG: prolipoprotein diacylglyceryl transferase [Ruminococcus sp.]|nr:prolipoprotein diacylglyceryl transferase [Ruminococcus sp.]
MKLHINTDYTGISPYPIMIILSFIVGLFVQYYFNVKRGINKNTSCKLILISPVMSVICAVLLTYYSSGRKYFGFSSIGGLVGMYMATLISAIIERKNGEIKIMLENCTFALPLMYSISKIGCLFAGCCHGIEYSGFLSVHYISNTCAEMALFPVQLLETIAFFIIFVVGIVLYKMHSRKSLYVTFGLSVSAKFIIDFFRESHNGKVLSFNQLLCLILWAVMIAVSWLYKRRKCGRFCLKRN